MPVAGAIAERVRAILPVTWDALSKDSRFGDALLQNTIDTIKEKTFGTTVSPSAESIYPLVVIDYVAKLAALELINPGTDYWRAEGPTSVGATGTNEQEVYVDPVATLKELRERLLAEVRAAWPVVKPLLGFSPLSSAPRPAINTLDDEFLTPSPQEFPRPYRVTERS